LDCLGGRDGCISATNQQQALWIFEYISDYFRLVKGDWELEPIDSTESASIWQEREGQIYQGVNCALSFPDKDFALSAESSGTTGVEIRSKNH
jgi:hypothetical protein